MIIIVIVGPVYFLSRVWYNQCYCASLVRTISISVSILYICVYWAHISESYYNCILTQLNSWNQYARYYNEFKDVIHVTIVRSRYDTYHYCEVKIRYVSWYSKSDTRGNIEDSCQHKYFLDYNKVHVYGGYIPFLRNVTLKNNLDCSVHSHDTCNILVTI